MLNILQPPTDKRLTIIFLILKKILKYVSSFQTEVMEDIGSNVTSNAILYTMIFSRKADSSIAYLSIGINSTMIYQTGYIDPICAVSVHIVSKVDLIIYRVLKQTVKS